MNLNVVPTYFSDMLIKALLWMSNGTAMEIGWLPLHGITSLNCLTSEIWVRSYKHSVVIRRNLAVLHGTHIMKDYLPAAVLMEQFYSGMWGEYLVVWNLWIRIGQVTVFSLIQFRADKEVGAIEQAHDSIVWTLAWHPLGHILCSGSNDHTSKFWTRNRPGDQMRDKYNLNNMPAGVSGLEEMEHGLHFNLLNFYSFVIVSFVVTLWLL